MNPRGARLRAFIADHVIDYFSQRIVILSPHRRAPDIVNLFWNKLRSNTAVVSHKSLLLIELE
jgi:hypothetical protein